MIAFYTLILSLFVATALVPLLVRYAGALRLVDLPDARKIHHGAIPRVGGIAIAAGALLAVVLFLPDRPEIVAYLVGALIIFAFGVADDRFDLDYRLKFFGQIAGALVLVLGGDLCITRVPFAYGGSHAGMDRHPAHGDRDRRRHQCDQHVRWRGRPGRRHHAACRPARWVTWPTWATTGRWRCWRWR